MLRKRGANLYSPLCPPGMVLTEAQGRLNFYIVVFQTRIIYILTSKQQSTFYTLAVYICLALQYFSLPGHPVIGVHVSCLQTFGSTL